MVAKELIDQQYKYLFEPELIKEISREGEYREFAVDEELIDVGMEIKYFPLILSGSLKVMTEHDDGSELLLYYLEKKDTCAMTLQCCLNKAKSKIRVVAEELTRLVLIRIERMEQWIVKYASWRSFVFDSYNNRLNEMLEVIDNLAFKNLGERLYKYLRDKAFINNSSSLKITHHQIALEMNTSRVVISRLMKKLQMDGKIVQDRNQVVISELVST